MNLRTCRLSIPAFSLLEVLISIALVVTLFGLLLSVGSKVRQAGKATKCTNNLRQIGVGLAAYISEHNGALIPAAVPTPEWFWYNELAPYMQQSGAAETPPDWVRCPAKKFRALTNETVGYGWNYMNFGWDLLRKNSWGYGSRLSQVTKPASTLIVGDSKDETISPENLYENRYIYTPPEKPELLAKRHGGRGNYLFLDGHVEALTYDYLQSSPWLYKKVQN